MDMEDEIKINLELNVNNKTLGAATGPPLSDNNIEAYVVTKQGLARLVGQCLFLMKPKPKTNV